MFVVKLPQQQEARVDKAQELRGLANIWESKSFEFHESLHIL